MASTIQLKTGTGSAVPSSLTQGELAINIDNGLFYYGSGSTNTTKQLESFTHITASGNISASGEVHALNMKINDQRLTIDNDNLTLPDTGLTVTGNITASGNISASGTVIADAITATLAAGTSNNVVVLNSSNQLVTDAVDGAIFGGAGAVLTSDNANETLAGVDMPDVTVGTATNAKTQRSTTNADFFPVMVDSTNATATAEALKTPTTGFTFNPSSKRLTVHNIHNVNTSHVTASGNISSSATLIANEANIIGNITASGDISSSGNVYANRFGNNLEIIDSSNTTTLAIDSAAGEGNSAFILAIDGTAKISLNKDAVATQFSGDTVFDSSITASGDISASGTIIANEANIIGNMTASGDLVVDGGNVTINGGNVDDSILKLATNTATSNDDVIIELVTDEDGTPRQARIGVDHSDNTLKLVHGSGFSGGTNGICVDSGGKVGIGIAAPTEELEIYRTGENAQIAITRGTDTQLKLKAQDNQTRITYEGGPLLFDRDESGTNSLTLGAGGHITASGNISASGHISASSNGAGFVVRPNLYWFATNTSETVAANDSDGAFPATNTTKIAWTEEVCSNQEVFVFGSDTLRIDRAGLYKFTYNVTLGINNGSNRTEGGVAIIKDPSGSPSVVDGSVTSTYNRFVEGGGLASRGTACATVVINVAANDVFQIDFAKICDTTDATKLKTLPEGTSWYVEALS